MTTHQHPALSSACDAREDREARSIVRWLSWGSLVPVLGWVYGIGLMWTSSRFRRRDKVIATVLFPGGWFGAFATVWVIASQSGGYCYRASGGVVGEPASVTESGCMNTGALPPALGLALALVTLLAAVGGSLYVRARARI